jgi:hypothetical protein
MRIVDPINLGMWLFYFKESTMKKVDTHFLDYRNLRCNKDPDSIFLSVHRKLRKPPVRKVPSTLNFSLTALRCVLGCLIGVVLLGLILILVPLALSRLSKRLLSGDRRQPDSSKSLSGVLLLSPL